MQAETESAVLEVNRGLLKELEDMGFSMTRAAWALHHSGNSSLEAAVNWIVDHENDSQFDKMPVVEFNIEIESPSPHDDTSETAQARANELKLVSLSLVNAVAKPSVESRGDERMLKITKKKPQKDPRTMRRVFETLLMIVRNAAKNPDEDKYRRIRVTNRLFQERVGRFKEGLEFMELCGFKRGEGSEFLSLVDREGDMSRLRDAAFQLQSAVTNPFFGLLSKEAAEE